MPYRNDGRTHPPTSAVESNTADSPSLGVAPAPKALTEKELRDLGALFKKGTVQLTAKHGTLHLPGSVLLQITADKVSLAALRKIIAAGKGTLPHVGGCALH